jgi:ribonuclease-3 family protein
VAKNAALHDYKIATGVECLMGYLYLSGSTDRCLELMAHALVNPN